LYSSLSRNRNPLLKETAMKDENPTRRKVIVTKESLVVLLTDHVNAERLLDSWFGK